MSPSLLLPQPGLSPPKQFHARLLSIRYLELCLVGRQWHRRVVVVKVRLHVVSPDCRILGRTEGARDWNVAAGS